MIIETLSVLFLLSIPIVDHVEKKRHDRALRERLDQEAAIATDMFHGGDVEGACKYLK
jgi:hypothetical protein